MADHGPINFQSITNLKLAFQLRSPGGKYPGTFCACWRRGGRYCSIHAIKRGECIFILKRRIKVITGPTGDKERWYKEERWRYECLTKYLKTTGDLFQISWGVSKQKRPGRARLDEAGLTKEQIANRKALQSRISAYKLRLAKYQAYTKPTARTPKAIENCKSRIQYYTVLLAASEITPTDTPLDSDFDFGSEMAQETLKEAQDV